MYARLGKPSPEKETSGLLEYTTRACYNDIVASTVENDSFVLNFVVIAIRRLGDRNRRINSTEVDLEKYVWANAAIDHNIIHSAAVVPDS